MTHNLKIAIGTLAVVVAISAVAFGMAANDSNAERELRTISTDMVNVKGEKIGMVTLEEGTQGVVLKVAASDLPNQAWHGIHLHKVGDCSDHEAGFKASGGHVGKGMGKHGFKSPTGPEAGDLPNVYVHTDGVLKAEMYSELVQFSGGDTGLMDEDGFAMVMHENPDDMITQPIGGAGARIACAAFEGK